MNDYVGGMTPQATNYKNWPSGPARQIWCSNVLYFLFTFYSFSCQALENTCGGVLPPFCTGWRVSMGIVFPEVSTL